MKLDNDLVRLMLVQIEADVDGCMNYSIEGYCEDRFPDYEVEFSVYHMKYLIDTRFVQAANGYFRDITPLGRDFLNNIRNDNVWAETKKTIEPFGTVALSVVSEIAASIVKKVFNLP